MIARLKGLVDRLGSDWAIIDVNGVGYLVFCSGKTLGQLAVGKAAALEIETHVREDHIHLYGFANETERDWFRLLTSVQGVGAKVGLAILGVLSGDELLQTIAAADKAGITRAPGVGPKLATRILSELKDKVGDLSLGHSRTPGAPASAVGGVSDTDPSAVRDAASALVNLGYAPADALGAVSRAAANMDDAPSVEALITAGLRDLAPVET
jgi:holliday junction DNA helicase RuvA